MHEELKKVIAQDINERADFERKLIERAWEDEAFKQELFSTPKAVYTTELGQELPGDIEIEVVEETANKIYLVVPNNPAAIIAEGELTEEALEAVAGGSWASVTRRSWVHISRRNANDLV